ncbi:MAG: DUF4258 domain-containing protein [Chitinophagales bacterium]|nr:DUF4258 domain-containing protein [Chitinophagales bacterium]
MQFNKRAGNTIALLILSAIGLVILGFKKCKESREQYPDRTINTTERDWRNYKLIYTKHARCRMGCREISEAEVEYILASGTINEEKSKEEADEATGNCDSYALEGNTKDGQHVRIVFGACEKVTKVITAIDLGEDHKCNCK